MDSVIVDWITLGVDTMISALMIIGIASLLMTANVITASVMEQEALTAELEEYHEHNAYDHTHVYQQDIISAIMKNRGYPAVYVQSSKGSYTWNMSGAPCDYKSADISERIDISVIYDADLEKDSSGAVIGYTFRPHTSGCGR